MTKMSTFHYILYLREFLYLDAIAICLWIYFFLIHIEESFRNKSKNISDD